MKSNDDCKQLISKYNFLIAETKNLEKKIIAHTRYVCCHHRNVRVQRIHTLFNLSTRNDISSITNAAVDTFLRIKYYLYEKEKENNKRRAFFALNFVR